MTLSTSVSEAHGYGGLEKVSKKARRFLCLIWSDLTDRAQGQVSAVVERLKRVQPSCVTYDEVIGMAAADLSLRRLVQHCPFVWCGYLRPEGRRKEKREL
jgi:hypothetical protein